MNNRWLINRTNPEFLQCLSKSASVSPLFAQVLVNRGLRTASAISDFLRPSLSLLSDPFDVPGISAAVARIRKAVAGGERILIHGDYDADGVSAAAILVLALRSLGADCLYFIPDRISHGYGFQPYGVGRAKQAGASLIVTVDCGITWFEAAAAARKEGIDVIVTDHHEPARTQEEEGRREAAETPGPPPPRPSAVSMSGVSLPDAAAVVNPKVTNCGTTVEHLSGAGVALKLVQALYRDRPDDLLPFFDLAAIGTVADVVPMTGENRIIVSTGLSSINTDCRPGVRALRKVSGMEGREIKAGRLAFSVIPRINAAGRLASSEDVVRLLTTDSGEDATEIALWLDGLNSERQRIEEEIFREACAKLGDEEKAGAIVLAGAGWHEGVIGIVASRIAERCSRPAIIFSVKNGIAKGSARSVPSFDICRALSDCRDLLISYGGHKQAAGIKLDAAKLGAFGERLSRLAASDSAAGADAGITIDADVGLSEINYGLMKELNMLEPLGLGNPQPLFGARMLKAEYPKVVGNNHLRLKLRQRACRLDAIGFDMGDRIDDFDLYGTIDAVFTPTINEWNGGRYLQLVLRAIRPSA
jgi:single-stranded-DNA-specific exonuclease